MNECKHHKRGKTASITKNEEKDSTHTNFHYNQHLSKSKGKQATEGVATAKGDISIWNARNITLNQKEHRYHKKLEKVFFHDCGM